MAQDIDTALRGWEYKPGILQARLVQATNGRQVIQMRVDLGILQIEIQGRPDGHHPHGCATYLDYLSKQAVLSKNAGQAFVLNEEQCVDCDRELIQFYHRRICWLALRNFVRAVEDADHTLKIMDFIVKHSPDEGYTEAHEQYRGFVWFQRTQAAVALALERKDPEKAIQELHNGLEKLRASLGEPGDDDDENIDNNEMLRQLQGLESTIRERHKIELTLQEQLDRAVADEDYELAARLRDQLRQQQQGQGD